MGQALYRTHRPKKLSEIVGQEHITGTLSQALKQGKISHAYLFTGPRGVGKTSIARILAHAINDLPYADDSPHLDIIEIDAASNRRIDEIRELRDKVYVAPTSAKYKVYIIDEVHMLTREAFNALLKTLEEPPAHAIFILATTDAHKLPETIISRTQRFTFKPVAPEKVSAHLAAIAKQEGVQATPEALELLAGHGEGSFRDSISLLDQAASHGGKLEVENVRELLGIPPAEAIDELLRQLGEHGNSASIMQSLHSLYDQGYQATAVAGQLAARLREQLTESTAILPVQQVLDLLGDLLEAPAAHDPERFLEICLLRRSSFEAKPPAVKAGPKSPDALRAAAKSPAVKDAKTKPKEAAGSKAEKFDASLWPEVLEALKKQHNTLYGVARMAQPIFNDDGGLRLNFAFAFHQKRLNETVNRQLLVGVIKELTGQNVIIECVVDKNASPPSVETPLVATDGNLDTISNIFGGGELLES